MSAIAMEVRGLTRRFGRRTAVQSLDLNVREGDVYGFLGPNGAGKTTAMRCILRLIRPNEGQVTIFGETRTIRQLRHVGAIVETPAFHGWMNGAQNLEVAAAYAGLGQREARTEIARTLDRVGLTERARDRTRTYSLGMKQRLAIARALLGKPRLLLLDEPTNGLDPRGMREVRDLIRSLALHDGITVFVSSHLLAEVQAICNRVGIIQEGLLRAEGQVDELLAESRPTHAVVDVGSTDAELLRTVLESIDGLEILGPGERGSLQVRLEQMDAAELNRSLVKAGVAVSALIPRARNLEDVFLEVTT